MEILVQSRVGEASKLPPSDIKIILLGDSAVGKSKLVERFLVNNYQERQLSTYALTLYRHNLELDGQQLKIDIWDTAGQECFNSLHASYYFGAQACILVFDVTRKPTYVNLKTWYKEMRSYCPDIPCILIANKIDINYEVTKKKFQFAEDHNIPLYYVSAADGTNVVQIFHEAVRKAMEYKQNRPRSFEADVMDLLEDDSWMTV